MSADDVKGTLAWMGMAAILVGTLKVGGEAAFWYGYYRAQATHEEPLPEPAAQCMVPHE